MPLSRYGRADRAVLRFRQDLAAQFRLPGRRQGGWYETLPNKGLRAMARVYAGWGFSQAFYREQLDIKRMGYASLEDFLVGFWEGLFLVRDPNNLLAMLWTWQQGDISANPVFNGNFEKALGAIKARALVMPGQTDLYFPTEDSQYEVKHMPNAKFLPIPSIWGHFAGGPGTNPDDVKFLDNTLKELMRS
jgi:homoserine O-acetyltransferase